MNNPAYRLVVALAMSSLSTTLAWAQNGRVRGFDGADESAASVSADIGLGNLYFGDEESGALAARLRGEWTSGTLGLGADLFCAVSSGDQGELDGPGAMVRAFPHFAAQLHGDSHDWLVGIRLGPEFIHAGAGDDLYFEFDGVGGKLAFDASFRLQGEEGDGLLGRIGIGFGFGSGEASGGGDFGEATVDDDTTSFDVELGVAYETANTTWWVSLVHQEIAFDFLDDSVGFDGLMVGVTLRL
jgi:hypothetical protein